MNEQDEIDLAKFRERERGELIDNLYRARLLSSYENVKLKTTTLRRMWRQYGEEMQQKAWSDGYDDFRRQGAGQRD